MSQPKENHILIKRHARYYKLGNESNYENLWIVCHGYAELASEFILKFSQLNDGKTLIVAPEGLSRFYKRGYFGDVGATWMTREDRIHEIEDQYHYLNNLYEKYTAGKELKSITVLGFSQGVATTSRWIASSRKKATNFICWAGEFPPDIKDISYLNEINTITAFADKDQFITQEYLHMLRNRYSDYGLSVQEFEFDGIHDIPENALKNVLGLLK